MSAESGRAKQEKAPQLIARVTFSRHEETHYTGVGRDITDRGIARAQEKGKATARDKGTPILIGHSPKERAKGTAESIEEGAQEELGTEAGSARWITVPGLSATEFRDAAILPELMEKFGKSQEAWTDAHYTDPDFYDNPDRIESNEEKRTRMYRELERLISQLEKKGGKDSREVPHLVFVSHYELLTLLLDDVFGIQTFGTTNAPTFGEHIDIDIYKPLQSGCVPIRVQYAGHEKQVLFDRSLRRLVAQPA